MNIVKNEKSWTLSALGLLMMLWSSACAPMITRQNVDVSNLLNFSVPPAASLPNIMDYNLFPHMFKIDQNHILFSVERESNGSFESFSIHVDLFELEDSAREAFDVYAKRRLSQPIQDQSAESNKQYAITFIKRDLGDVIVFGHQARLPTGSSIVAIQNGRLFIYIGEDSDFNDSAGKQPIIDTIAASLHQHLSR